MRVGVIRTYTGRTVNVLDLQPSDVDLVDLAHHLSLENRWSGASSRAYSVAEHSIWVARWVRKLVPAEVRDLACLYALLHDAHEAYFKDIPTPMKRWLDEVSNEAYSDACARADVAIYAHFNLAIPEQGIKDAIHLADGYCAWSEAQALCPKGPAIRSVPPEGLAREMDMVAELRYAHHSTTIEDSYLAYFRSLMKLVA